MSTKKLKKVKSLDEFGIDDFNFDMDFGDIDVKDTRTPVTKVKQGFKNSFNPKKHGANFAKTMAFATLPKGYSSAADEAINITGDITSLYEDTRRELAPAFSVLKSIGRSADAVVTKYLPKKIADKIRYLSEEDKQSEYYNSNNNSNESEITETLQGIFGAQNKKDDVIHQTDITHRNLDREISKKQFSYSANLQKSMATNLTKLANYQDTVMDQYLRKSLELQHRQYFAQKELLDVSKASNQELIRELKSITKNTALPNEVKVTNHEMFASKTKDVLIGKMQNSMRGNIHDLVDKVRKGILNNAKNFASDVSSSYGMATSISGMGMDTHEEAGKFGGGVIRDSIGKRSGKYLAANLPKLANKINPNLYGKIEAGGQHLERMTGNYKNVMIRKMKDSNGEGIWGMLSNSIGSSFGIGDRINKNLNADASAAVPWDLISRRTLIEIIPGFMSRSLEKQTDIYNLLAGNGEKAERKVYSTTKEAFVSRSSASKDLKTQFKNKISASVRDDLNEIINYIDPDGTQLTPSERVEFSLLLAKDAGDQIAFDPTKYMNEWELPANLRQKIPALISEAFDISSDVNDNLDVVYKYGSSTKSAEARNRLSNNFKNVSSGLGDFNDIYNKQNEIGNKSTLRDIKALNEKGEIDPKFRWELVKELLNADDTADYFKPKKEVNPIEELFKNTNIKGKVKKGYDDTVAKLTGAINRLTGDDKPLGGQTKIDGFDRVAEAVNRASVDTNVMLEQLLMSESKNPADTKQMGYWTQTAHKLYGLAKGAIKLPFTIHRNTGWARSGMQKTLGFLGKKASGLGKTYVPKAAQLALDANLGISKFYGKQLLKAPGRAARFGSAVNTVGQWGYEHGKAPVGYAVRKGAAASAWAGKKGLKAALYSPPGAVGAIGKGISMSAPILGEAVAAGTELAGDMIGAIPGMGWVPKAGENARNKYRSIFTLKDVYVKGEDSPRLTAAGISKSKYVDVKSRKIIHTMLDITGEVKDIDTGNVILSNDDFALGLVDVEGKPFTKLKVKEKSQKSNSLFSRLKLPKNMAFGSLGINTTIIDKTLGAIFKKDDKIAKSIDELTDYLKDANPEQSSEEKEANRSGGVNDIIKQRAQKKKDKEDAINEAKAKSINAGTVAATKSTTANESILDSLGKYKDKAVKLGESASGVWGAVKASKFVRPFIGGAEALGGEGAAATVAGGGVIASGLTIGAVLGAAYAATLGIKKGLNVITNRRTLKQLEMLKLLQYGVPIDNKNAVITIRYFEDSMEEVIEITDDGKLNVNISEEDLWGKFATEFGNTKDNNDDHKRFMTWFRSRFLKVYIKHYIAAKSFKCKVPLVDYRLNDEERVKFVSEVQFGGDKDDSGLTPYSVTTSPWHDIALSDNRAAIDTLTEQIRNGAKRGADKSLKNTSTIKAGKPALAAAAALAFKPVDDKYTQSNLEAAKKAATEGGSFYDKAVDWTTRNVFERGARIIEKGKEYAGKAGAAVAGAAISAGKWANTNIIQPVANSLAGLIRGAESGKAGYNAYNRGTTATSILGPIGPRDLVHMTIGEILADMGRDISDPKRLFAVGKYQMIPDTLKDGIRRMGISPDTLYNEATQEKLFSGYLLDKKRQNISAYIKGKSDNLNAAMVDASSEWASIADPRTGASHYGHGNKASVTTDQISSALTKSRTLYKQFVAQGLSEEEAYQKATSVEDTSTPTTALASNDKNTTSGAPGGSPASNATTPNAGSPNMGSTPSGASVASNGATPIGLGIAKAGNDLATTTSNAMTPSAIAKNIESTKSTADGSDYDTPPSIAAVAANNVPTLDTTPKVPDLSHVSKATYDVGEDASKQRSDQLSEQQKTNELLAQLVKLAATNTGNSAMAAAAANLVASNQNKPPQRQITPVINLSKNLG